MEWEILAKCYLHDVQKRECWDSMKFKGRAIKVRSETSMCQTIVKVLISRVCNNLYIIILNRPRLSPTGLSLRSRSEELPPERANRKRHGGPSLGSEHKED